MYSHTTLADDIETFCYLSIAHSIIYVGYSTRRVASVITDLTGVLAVLGGTVALLVGHRTCDLQVAGSSRGWAPPHTGLRQAAYTLRASVIKQYNLVPAKGQ